MKFGVTNGPTIFQSLMNKAFAPYLRKFVLVFFYDILVYSKDVKIHKEHLKIVFELLRQQQLYAKMIKCVIAKKKVEYFGAHHK